jgi:hypothetical protein
MKLGAVVAFNFGDGLVISIEIFPRMDASLFLEFEPV